MLRTMDNSTFELMLTQPVPIEPGDILGVELPGSSVEMLRLHFQDRGIGMAPISYQSPEASYPLFDVGLSAPNVQYLPLITPVIGMCYEVCSSLITSGGICCLEQLIRIYTVGISPL